MSISSDHKSRHDFPSITGLANRWSKSKGEEGVDESELFDLIYQRLHDIAHAHMAQQPQDAILQTTMVMNEAFLKMARSPQMRWSDREHFFAYCSRVMRHVLVDLARGRARSKRGAGALHVTLERAAEVGETQPSEDVLAIHHALVALESIDPERAQIVELRYFGGMEPREIGRSLGLSESTVHRRWRVARAWLYEYLEGDP